MINRGENMQELLENGIEAKVKDKKLLVAVSGGADSMCLLHQLVCLNMRVPFEMQVIHVNHNLRGKESDCDQSFVINMCNKYGVKCNVLDIDVHSESKKNKQTIEQAARELRYKAFFDLKNKGKFDYILIAHNKDDQAETVLMHICRGSGIDGAGGIKDRPGILRPLLGTSRKQILEYLKNNNLGYREDSSNSSIEYTRNFVRHEIIPRLEQIYPNIKENLFRFAKLAQKDADFIESCIEMGQILHNDGVVKIKASIFYESDVLYSRYVRKCLQMLGVFADVEQKHIQLVKELSQSQNGNYICLPHGVFVSKEYDFVVFGVCKPQKLQTHNLKYSLSKISFGKTTFEIQEINEDDIIFGNGDLYFDLDSIPSSAVFRTKKDSDKFKKLGSGTKKFNDYLTDKKVPLRKRNEIILLCDDNKVLLAVGLDISDDIKITSGTTRFGRLKIIHKN